jgi:hypothetical protein
MRGVVNGELKLPYSSERTRNLAGSRGREAGQVGA